MSEIWSVALLLSDGQSTAMTLTLTGGKKAEVIAKAVKLAGDTHPTFMVSAILAEGFKVDT